MVTEHITAMFAGRTVIAVVNYHDGELFDWAAYQASDNRMPAHEIADHGDKMSSSQAFELYPQLASEKWRA